jgi:L-alanine-DL-glutamate epimerase-like enolase superfamily enzyme
VVKTSYPVDCEGHVSFLTLGTESPFRGGITLREGRARLPDAAGLGIDVDWDALARHTARAARVIHGAARSHDA